MKPRLKHVQCTRGGITAHNAHAIIRHQTPGRMAIGIVGNATVIHDPGVTYRIAPDGSWLLVCRRLQ